MIDPDQIIMFSGGGDFDPVQQAVEPVNGLLTNIPYEKFWDQIMIAVGAVVASAVAWWKSLRSSFQVAIALGGMGLLALVVMV